MAAGLLLAGSGSWGTDGAAAAGSGRVACTGGEDGLVCWDQASVMVVVGGAWQQAP